MDAIKITSVKYKAIGRSMDSKEHSIELTAELNEGNSVAEAVEMLKRQAHEQLEDYEEYQEWQGRYRRLEEAWIEGTLAFKKLKTDYEKLCKWTIATGVSAAYKIPPFPEVPALERALEELENIPAFTQQKKLFQGELSSHEMADF